MPAQWVTSLTVSNVDGHSLGRDTTEDIQHRHIYTEHKIIWQALGRRHALGPCIGEHYSRKVYEERTLIYLDDEGLTLVSDDITPEHKRGEWSFDGHCFSIGIW